MSNQEETHSPDPSTPPNPPVPTAAPPPPAGTTCGEPDPERFICREIEDRQQGSRRGQRAWSFLTHGSTIAIAVFSVCAALLTQHSGNLTSIGIDYPAKNLAAMLSVLVTIITTIQAKIGFERKWIANRMTQSALSQLQVDAKMGTLTPQALADQYKKIIAQHDTSITTGS